MKNTIPKNIVFFLQPKKILFGQNFRPKKILRTSQSLKYVSGAAGVKKYNWYFLFYLQNEGKLEEELVSFRQQWQEELISRTSANNSPVGSDSHSPVLAGDSGCHQSTGISSKGSGPRQGGQGELAADTSVRETTEEQVMIT